MEIVLGRIAAVSITVSILSLTAVLFYTGTMTLIDRLLLNQQHKILLLTIPKI